MFPGGYVDRRPRKQLPHDPSKKNLVILGNGWASTSLLKTLDTEAYNVVSSGVNELHEYTADLRAL